MNTEKSRFTVEDHLEIGERLDTIEIGMIYISERILEAYPIASQFAKRFHNVRKAFGGFLEFRKAFIRAENPDFEPKNGYTHNLERLMKSECDKQGG